MSTLTESPKLSLPCHFTDVITEASAQGQFQGLRVSSRGRVLEVKSDQREKLGDLLFLKVPLGIRWLPKEGHDQRHKATMAESQAPKEGDLLGSFGMRGTS